MNLRRESAIALAKGVVAQANTDRVDVVLCPPAVYLAGVIDVVAGSRVGVGAQNMSGEKDGAFTGEISSGMLVDLGCKFVILGHSERRQFFGETDQSVNKKLHLGLASNLIPIVCVGETLGERESGRTQEVVASQVSGSLAGLNAGQMEKTVIAYEPVWAIGTGKVATPQQAEEVHAQIRTQLRSLHGAIADRVIIQYGGSVKPDNAKELMHQPNIDGALVGGASLKVGDFLGIIEGSLN